MPNSRILLMAVSIACSPAVLARTQVIKQIPDLLVQIGKHCAILR